jgi:hypothetical protein
MCEQSNIETGARVLMFFENAAELTRQRPAVEVDDFSAELDVPIV